MLRQLASDSANLLGSSPLGLPHNLDGYGLRVTRDNRLGHQA